jgi:hypothetical protein
MPKNYLINGRTLFTILVLVVKNNANSPNRFLKIRIIFNYIEIGFIFYDGKIPCIIGASKYRYVQK